MNGRQVGSFVVALALLGVGAGCADDPVPDATPGAGNAGGADGGGGSGGGAPDDGWDWQVPLGFPKPKVPADNPMSVAKVELGRHLFYDRRLSGNETQACASCHEQARAFTDGRDRAVGSTGEIHPRSSMSLGNVGYFAVLTWANPVVFDLEPQAGVPMYGTEPVELGLAGLQDELLARLAAEPYYATAFPEAFPDDAEPLSLENVQRAIAAFERTLITARSRYDRYAYDGDPDALTEQELRGKDLFNDHPFECFHCHGGFAFADSVEHQGTAFAEANFHNTGLYNGAAAGAYPAPNRGVYELTGDPADMGKFRAPSLRNIAVTAPYMHDGSIATLEEVVDHYAAGGRTIAEGPNAGIGSDSPLKSDLVAGFTIRDEDKAALVAFLKSLTDESFLEDPRFGDPWSEDD